MVNKATKPTDALIGYDAWNIQLDKNGNLKHFLTTEGLGTEVLTKILDTAESFADINETKLASCAYACSVKFMFSGSRYRNATPSL